MVYYFDNAATTPLIDAAKNELRECEAYYGNASTLYSVGKQARKKLEEAREIIAECIGADNRHEIIFTSGGTEADNMAINHFKKLGQEIYYSPYEHSAILEPLKDYHRKDTIDFMSDDDMHYIKRYFEVTKRYLEGTKNRPLEDQISITCMLANNETGIISPIEKIGEIVPHRLFHVDAVQAVGHININMKMLGVDMLSASGHKFGAPKGIGFLYVKDLYDIEPFIKGGEQEHGLRAGTENVGAACAMAAALKWNCEGMRHNFAKVAMSRDYIQRTLLENIDGAVVNGNSAGRLAGHLSITIPGMDAQTLQATLDTYGICIGVGSACHSQSMQPSHVLKAMGLTDSDIYQTIRISVGVQNTMEECQYLCKKIIDTIREVR